MAEIINLDHYIQHRIVLHEREQTQRTLKVSASRRRFVEPYPRIAVQDFVEINRVTDECPHFVTVPDYVPGGEWVRETCLQCGRVQRHRIGGGVA